MKLANLKKREKPEESEKKDRLEKKEKPLKKRKPDNDRYAELKDSGRINARIIDVSSGLRVIGKVYAVRIHSREFTALIMNDYIPALGKIDGDVVFLSRDGEYPYYGITGFYKHQHNEFTLLIEEHDTGKEDREYTCEDTGRDSDEDTGDNEEKEEEEA